jgi:hypothetical protein
MLRLDLTQVPRLLQIETNTHERLDEARRMRWLGEVAALEESLRHIDEKSSRPNDFATGSSTVRPVSKHWTDDTTNFDGCERVGSIEPGRAATPSQFPRL